MKGLCVCDCTGVCISMVPGLPYTCGAVSDLCSTATGVQ